MKKLIAVLLTLTMLVGLMAAFGSVSAADGYLTATDLKFYGADGAEETPGTEGDDWGLFPYWKGYMNSQIYDVRAIGAYVETKVNCSKFWVGFGNGGDNACTNIEIYVDGNKVATHNSKNFADGAINKTDVIEVTPGEHTIRVAVGNYTEGWNGMTFCILRYVPNTTDTYTLATNVTFYGKDGDAETPDAEGADWKTFPYWPGFDGSAIYDTNVTGAYATTTVSCSKFWVGFGNGDENGHTNIEIYVDGQLVKTHRQKGNGGGILNQTDIIEVTPGEHTITVKAGTPAEDGWNGMCFNCIQYVAYTAPETTPAPATTAAPTNTAEQSGTVSPAPDNGDALLAFAVVCALSVGAVISIKSKKD